MPSCSVAVCKNRSGTTNVSNSGVSHHLFPKCPKIKEKWIKATGRPDNWFPTRVSTICSIHFEEAEFVPAQKNRRLFPTSVPTLKLRLVFENKKSEENTSTNKTFLQPETGKTIEQQYNDRLLKYKKVIKEQRSKIKRLQRMVRWYRDKKNNLKEILDALREEHAIGEDHMWLLESEHLK